MLIEDRRRIGGMGLTRRGHQAKRKTHFPPSRRVREVETSSPRWVSGLGLVSGFAKLAKTVKSAGNVTFMSQMRPHFDINGAIKYV